MALMALKTTLNAVSKFLARSSAENADALAGPRSLSRYNVFKTVLDMLVPPACPICRVPVAFDDGVCASCWQEIDFITGPLCRITGLPMPVDLGDETISPLARANPPPYFQARAAFAYRGSGAALIKRMKFGDRPELARLLAKLIWTRISDALPRHGLLVRVPLHRRRLMWRRFNQSAELCRALSALGGHSMALEAVARIRPTRRQIGLTRAGRKRNLRGAFAVPDNQKHKIKGRAIIIVDDVLTTGATVEAMARILRRAGSGPIYVVTAARVVLPERV